MITIDTRLCFEYYSRQTKIVILSEAKDLITA